MQEPEWPFPYKDGELLKIVRGGFRGEVIRVDGGNSFWSDKSYYEGNPEKGILNEKGWQVVVDCEVEGKGWLYFVREHEDEVKRLTRRV